LAPPEKAVKDIENQYMQNSSGIGAVGSLSVASQFPQRPGHGTQGKRIAVYANYFKLVTKPGLNLWRYNIEVKPEVKGRKLRRIFELLFERPEFAGVATDYKTMVISNARLNIPDDARISIQYRGEGEDEPISNSPPHEVRVVTPAAVPVAELIKNLSSTNPGPTFPNKEEHLQTLNAVLAFYPVGHRQVSNRKEQHYLVDGSPQNAHNIRKMQGGLDALRGFFQSVRAATGGLLLNVNVTHGVFLHPDALARLYISLGSEKKETLSKKLRLIRVRLTHIPPKKSKTTGEEFPRIKTILALATMKDGRYTENKDDPHPPKVSVNGAGPKGVQFWLGSEGDDGEGSGKGKGKDKPKAKGPKMPTNQYITVFDYFKISAFG
jgi:hypothetical protein